MEKLIPTPGKATLSDVQETFQKYLQRIEQLRQDLQNYESWEAMARERVKQEILPLEEAVVDAHVRRVHLFNDAYHSKAFKKAEKGALREFIIQESSVLIRRFGREDLRAIYNEHTGQETKAEKDRLEELKELFSQQYGISFEGVRLKNEQELRAYVAEQMAKQQARQEEKRQKRAEKKEKRKQKKAVQLPEVVPTELIPLRKLYMNLVKRLHPDRERDEVQREHKTRLMQELTEAYQQGNWFALLKLQSEQPEASQTDDFQEMAAYNQALKKQADQLQSQLNEVRKSDFQARFVAEPRQMDAKFAQEIKRLKATIQQLQEELKRSRNPEHLKDLIRNYV
ncbi:J domain-containing protein [Siphonobacter sp. BAB-5405]|uniref:J domain-containing protein n=1 Tax=Siphonobacter sp. BAB-5405 TaxID=1864825 RepID=UPI0011AF9C9C|nr:J domain-containing protein [Siphonobacter sp. BAB-5405]